MGAVGKVCGFMNRRWSPACTSGGGYGAVGGGRLGRGTVAHVLVEEHHGDAVFDGVDAAAGLALHGVAQAFDVTAAGGAGEYAFQVDDADLGALLAAQAGEHVTGELRYVVVGQSDAGAFEGGNNTLAGDDHAPEGALVFQVEGGAVAYLDLDAALPFVLHPEHVGQGAVEAGEPGVVLVEVVEQLTEGAGGVLLGVQDEFVAYLVDVPLVEGPVEHVLGKLGGRGDEATLRHACKLGAEEGGVVHVLDDVGGYHVVERLVLEGQVVGVGHHEGPVNFYSPGALGVVLDIAVAEDVATGVGVMPAPHV